MDSWKARLNNPGIAWYPDGMGETPALILGYVDVQYKFGIYTRDEQKIDRPCTHHIVMYLHTEGERESGPQSIGKGLFSFIPYV